MKSKRKFVLLGLGSLIVISIVIVLGVMKNRQPELQEPSDITPGSAIDCLRRIEVGVQASSAVICGE